MPREERRERLDQLMRVGKDVTLAACSLAPRSPERYGGMAGTSPGLLLNSARARHVTASCGRRTMHLNYAERVKSGRFELLGYGEVELDRPLDFSHDPLSQSRWPLRHGMTVNYRSGRYGDPKWIWELNRLQHVPALLCAWHLTDDDGYLSAARSDLTAWLEHSRPGYGVGWVNAFEPALRVISLALSLDALRAAGTEYEALRRALIDSITDHVGWITRYPSTHSSANNHRLAELVAPIVTSMLSPESCGTAPVPEQLAELEGLVLHLFYPDGGYAEQSFSYATFALDLLVLVVATLAASGANAPDWLCDVIARADRAIGAQSGMGGYLPDYGDRDDGQAFILDGGIQRDVKSIRCLLRAAIGVESPGADATATWLFCGRAPARSAPPPGPGDIDGFILPDTGVVLMRREDTCVQFDVGCLGLSPIAAHGHADALHVTVLQGDAIVIGDPGTGSYYGSPRVRGAFRGTGFHATVLVDGVDQAIPQGPFLWGSLPNAAMDFHDSHRRAARGHHDGYQRLPAPVAHVRTVVLVDEGLVAVRDDLVSSGRHVYSQRWPVNPDCRLVESRQGVARFAGEIEFSVVTTVPVTPLVYCGSRTPFLGWWSDRLESVRPAPLLTVETSGRGPVTMISLIACGVEVPVVTQAAGGTTVVTVGDKTSEIDWSPRPDGGPCIDSLGVLG